MLSLLATATLALQPGFMYQQLVSTDNTHTRACSCTHQRARSRCLQPAGKGSFLLHTWTQSAMTVRANGFSPASEAVGDGAFKMKSLASDLTKYGAQAKILGLCEQGTLNFDSLEEPHASVAERLSKTRMMAALSAGQGSAVAFVSEWPDHVCIDACLVNPGYLVLGEGAEAALLESVVATAMEKGVQDVRMRPMFQVDGDAFYERCGFFPGEGYDAEDEGRFLSYRGSGGGAAAAPAGGAKQPQAESSGGAFGAPPDGFEWGGAY